jgi:hypothetical protein
MRMEATPFFDSKGYLYVVDAYNQRIQKFAVSLPQAITLAENANWVVQNRKNLGRPPPA